MSENGTTSIDIAADAQQQQIAGGVLYDQWNDAQQMNYDILEQGSSAFTYAFVVALTQYVVAQYISKTDRGDGKNQRPKVYWASCFFVFWVLYVLLFNSSLYSIQGTETPMGYRIAVPLLVFLGVPFHLLLDRVWTMKQRKSNAADHEEEEVGAGGDEEKNGNSIQNELLAADNDGTNTNGDKMEDVELVEAPAQAEATTSTTAKKEKVHYINNIKIFLTNMVILHHVATACGGDPGGWNLPQINSKDWINSRNPSYIVLMFFVTENSAYFMGLFFFFSGFFVPKSFDRKGQRTFLFERVKRLGIPQVVFSFLIGPYILWGLGYLLWGNDQANPAFIPPLKYSGPTWFLQQLIVFGILYSFVCKKDWSLKMECPTVLGFFLWSVIIGVLIGLSALFYSNRDYMAVPNFWRDYTQYVFYFFGGCIAQRNDWMTELKTNRSRIAIYTWLVFGFLTLFFFLFYLSTVLDGSAYVFVSYVLWYGVVGVGNSLAVTVFFMDFVNGSYWCTKFFAESMYTAYILHFIPIIFSLRCWVWVLQSIDGIMITPNDGGIVTYEYTNDSLMIPGFLMVGTITMIILWPLAYGIRSIPGFSKVL